jgi:hypothetical protein
MKGAAFSAACMLECQNNPAIDMIMYYDARPTAFNGLFSMYTYRPLKGYYPFYLYSNLYELKNHYKTETDDDDVYAVCAKNGDNVAVMITYYAEDDNKNHKMVTIDASSELDGAKIYVLDKDHTLSLHPSAKINDGKLTVRMERNSVLYIEK